MDHLCDFFRFLIVFSSLKNKISIQALINFLEKKNKNLIQVFKINNVCFD